MPENLGTAILNLKTDSTKFDKGMDSAESRSAKLGKSFAKAAAAIAVAAGAAFVAFSVAAIKAASDAAETTAKFETVFGTASDGMNDFIRDLQTTVPATTKELQDMSSSLQDLLVPMGVLPDQAVEMNKKFVTLAGDLASFNNIPMDAALNKLRAGLVGSSEPLLALGVDTRVAALETKALELGLIEVGETLDSAARAQAVLAIATEQSAFAMGDAAATAGSTANQMKFLKRDFAEVTQTIGEMMLPIFNILLGALVEIMGTVRDNAGAWTVLAKVLALPIQAFFKFMEVAFQLQAAFQQIKGGILAFVKSIDTALGRFSPFKDSIDDIQTSIDIAAIEMLNAKDAANEWSERQQKLTEVIKKMGVPTKEAAKATDKLTKSQIKAEDAAGDLTKTEKKLTDSLRKYVAQVKKSIRPTVDITRKYDALAREGLDLTEIMFDLNDEIDAAVQVFRDLGRELPKELQLLVDLQAESRLATGELTRLISATDGLAKLPIARSLEQYEDALKGVTDEAAETARGVRETNERFLDAARGAGTAKGAVEDLTGGFSDFLGDIDSDIVPGIGRIKSVFDSVVGTVTGFIGTIDSIIGLFSEGGAFANVIGGLGKFSDFFTGGEGGGGILQDLFKGPASGSSGGGGLTTSFTELAITGVAIQTGIFATGVSLTGVQIQSGVFNTGVSLTGISIKFPSFGGSRGQDFVEEHLRFIRIGFLGGGGLLDRLTKVQGFLNAIKTNIVFNVASLKGIFSMVSGKMDTLIGIQRDLIAPAVEGIQTRLDSTVNVKVANQINVNVTNTGSVATAVGSSIAAQNRDLVAMIKREIQTNQFGLRSEIAKVS